MVFVANANRVTPIMSKPKTLIEAQDIHLSLSGKPILSHVDLQVPQGKIITLIGPNGAGKSTLVKVMLGLIEPNQGSIFRSEGLCIGYTPQKVSIPENMPLTVERFLTLAKGSHASEVTTVAHETGITPLLNHAMQTLSGGEHQRVLLTRALLRNPNLLVLDEPVQGVDVTGQAELYNLIARLRDERGLGVLMISHDLHLVMAATDSVVCLNSHVCCSGHPDTVSQHPAYLELFGQQSNPDLAIYTHHHDHTHDIHGDVIACGDGEHRHG